MDKEQQKKLLTEIMEADEKDGLYKTNNMEQQTVSKMERVQTAVEWLLNYIERENWSLPPDVEELVKKIDKEQRIKDYNAGYTDAQCNHVNDAENYANEQDYLNSKPTL